MKKWKFINAGAYGTMVAVNALSELIPLGGKTTGQISEQYPNLFTPAPITFAIWGVIYLMLLGFVIYQWVDRNGGDRVRAKIGPWFAVSCGMNIAWLITWHLNAIGLSVICMAGLLITLVILSRRIAPEAVTRTDRLMAKAGFDLYLGWIIAAAIANVSVYLVRIGWNGLGVPAVFWTVAVILIGAVIGFILSTNGKMPLAGASIVWAYMGILIRHLTDMTVRPERVWIIVVTILGIITVINGIAAGLAGCTFGKTRKEKA